MNTLTIEADDQPCVEGRRPSFSPANLRAARKRHGLFQAQLAERVGCHPRTFQRYELGEIVPPVEVLCRLAAVLWVPIGDLFD